MGGLLREMNWEKTDLGPVESWSQALLTISSLMMASTFPMSLWWGPKNIVLYNDGYVPMTGEKHPALFGSPAQEYWNEIWDTLGPALEAVKTKGESTFSSDQCLMMHRHGFVEVGYPPKFSLCLREGNLLYLGLHSRQRRYRRHRRNSSS
jgi:hypothetical protein